MKTAVASTLKAHPGPHGQHQMADDQDLLDADDFSATPSPRRLQAPPPSPWCSPARRRKPGWVATGTVVASPSTRAPTGRVAAGVAGALHISPDKMANSAFTVRLAVAFSGTYDCNQHVSSKAQHKHTLLISFTGITEEEAVAALSSLHRRENASVPFTGVSAIAMLPDIPIFEGKSDRPSHARNLRVEVGLTGHEAKFLALVMDGLAPADDQGMRFSVKFQPPRSIDIKHWAPCISNAATCELAPYFNATAPTAESILRSSPSRLSASAARTTSRAPS